MSEDLAHDLQKIGNILQCQICTEFMSSPFVLTCGHNFCLTCIREWLTAHRNCPICRSSVKHRPVLNYVVREILEILIRRQDILSAETSSWRLQQEAQDDFLRENIADPFPGLFRNSLFSTHGGRLRDHEDNIVRCIRCHWEVEGDECL